MILIIGGAYHNKLAYALKTYNISVEDMQNGADYNIDEACSKKVIYNLHLLIKRYIKQGLLTGDNYNYITEKITSSNIEIIICDEIGSGIIPLDKFEREYRDTVGKIVSIISEKACKVIRIYYGIPTILKG